jgi:hypothetical protein
MWCSKRRSLRHQAGARFVQLGARQFELTPLGRGHEQMETYVRLLHPGGTPSWRTPIEDLGTSILRRRHARS